MKSSAVCAYEDFSEKEIASGKIMEEINIKDKEAICKCGRIMNVDDIRMDDKTIWNFKCKHCGAEKQLERSI